MLAILIELFNSEVRYYGSGHVDVQVRELEDIRWCWIVRCVAIGKLPSLEIEPVLMDHRTIRITLGLSLTEVVLGQTAKHISYIEACRTG